MALLRRRLLELRRRQADRGSDVESQTEPDDSALEQTGAEPLQPDGGQAQADPADRHHSGKDPA
jgi:hypothetical protein